MTRNRLMLFPLCGGLLLIAACSPLQPTLSPVSVEPTLQDSLPAGPTIEIPDAAVPTQELKLPLTLRGTPQPAGGVPGAVSAAVQDLSLRLNIAPDQIAVISYDAETWPDGCLGLGRPDEACLQVLTPGYLIFLEASGERYEYHTDQTGQILRLAGDTIPGAFKPGLDVQKPRAILLAMQALSQAAGIPMSDISLVSAEAARWPNACLGLEKPGENCAEVITDGWIIILAAAGQHYEFHTDQSGEIVRQRQP